MESLFLGEDSQIRRVYPPEICAFFAEKAGLHPEVIAGKADLERLDTTRVRFLFGTWGFPTMTEEEIARYFPNLEAVFYSAGTVQPFARPFLERGVRMFSAWAANAVPVAEYCCAQILLANKGFFQLSAGYSQGGKKAVEEWMTLFPGNYGCKVGIIGAGMIGKLVIGELKKHQLKILVYDPFLPENTALELGVTKAPLEQLFSECQTISNHLANNPQTVGLLHAGLFSRMKPGAVFINTGRGAQVVEPDLCRVLQERPDIMAVLDVTWPEPPEKGHLFYSLPNVVMTPHIAGSIGDEVCRMAKYMAEEFSRYLAGKSCRYEVTKEMLATMA